MGSTVVAPRSVQSARAHFRWGRLLKILAIVVPVLTVLAYAGVSVYVADQLSAPPRRAIVTDLGKSGLAYETVTFTSTVDAVRLAGWFIDSPGSTAVLMLHGRAAARDDGPAPEVAAALVHNGYDVLMFDFRASGLSGGDRYTLGQKETRDVAGAVQYLKERGATGIAGFGTSMGAATLIKAAADLPEIGVVVADSAFADLSLLLDSELPKLSGLPEFFNPGITLAAKLFFDTDLAGNKPVRSMPLLDGRPVFLIHTEGDDTIPVEHAYLLQQAAHNPQLQVWIATGSGHTAAFRNHREEYLQRVVGFFEQYLR